MDRIIKNPKGSHVYSNELTSIHTTPSGSHIFHCGVFYKHQIPSGFVQTKSTLKGSKIYRFVAVCISSSTPKGSNNHTPTNFYKPEIPSGFNTKQHYAAK
jgi:hypothetical protein